MGGENIPKIRKSCGAEEEFDPNRLQNSIRAAGASDDIARSVSERVSKRIRSSESVSSESVSGLVTEELDRASPSLSGAYRATENMRAISAPNVNAGVAQVPDDLVKRFGLKFGEQVNVLYQDRKAQMKVQPVSALDPRDIVLSKQDLDRLKAPEGSRVSVRMPARGT